MKRGLATTPDKEVDLLLDPEVKVVSPLIDLEVSLAILPEVHRRIRRLMEIKGLGEMMVRAHLKDREGRQRVYGATVYGLKDGAWQMEEWEARALLKFLTTYVGDDFTQEQLDKAIADTAVEFALKCSHDGHEWMAFPACPKCGKPPVRLVVNHTGINAIYKVARKEVKEKIDTLRRRAEPTVEIKTR